MNNFGLTEDTINKITGYFKLFPEIDKVIIYGSRAKGTFKNGSDIDFAILTNDNINLFKIAGGLDDLPTPYKFDVLNYKTIEDNDLKDNIDKYGKIFYYKK